MQTSSPPPPYQACYQPPSAPYPPPPPGYVPRAYAKPHRGPMVLTLGILSLAVCALCGPFAWNMGTTDLREMDQGLMDPAGREMTSAGRICGMIGTAIFCLTLVVILFIVLVAVLAAASAG